MPARGMVEPSATGSGMPSAAMSEPVPGGKMPTGGMGGGGGQDQDQQRFGPTQTTPTGTPAAAWEPGEVEVQFRDGVAPTVVAAAATRGAGAEPTLRSPAGVDLTDFNRIVQAHGLQRAEPTLNTPAEEAATAQTAARQLGMDIPNLASFVTLHFPDGSDTAQIARELEQLPEVVRAVPVPKAIPPQTPLNEPLVGTSNQVVWTR